MKGFVASMERLLSAERLATVRAGLRPDLEAEVRGAQPLTWLPLEVNLHLTDVCWSVLGAGEGRAFFRDMFVDATKLTAIRGLVSGLQRFATLAPNRAMRWFPRGYELVFRDNGRWTVTRESKATLLTLEDASRDILNGPSWLRSTEACLDGVPLVLGRTGWGELLHSTRTTGWTCTATWRLHWDTESFE